MKHESLKPTLIYVENACHKKRDKKPPALSVVTATVIAKDVPVYLSALGTVTPFQSVTVKTQINGYLMKVLFKEGQLVKKGDLLAEIDDLLGLQSGNLLLQIPCLKHSNRTYVIC